MKLLLTFIFFISLIVSYSQTIIERTSIKKIVDKLTKEKILHLGAPVGDAGISEKTNKYYNLYKKLEKKATDLELVALTKDTSKTILLYSFTILHHRNYLELKYIFIQYQNDSSEVWQAGGCTGVVWKINSYMLNLLNPSTNKTGNNYLTKQEYQDYFKKIGF